MGLCQDDADAVLDPDERSLRTDVNVDVYAKQAEEKRELEKEENKNVDEKETSSERRNKGTRAQAIWLTHGYCAADFNAGSLVRTCVDHTGKVSDLINY